MAVHTIKYPILFDKCGHSDGPVVPLTSFFDGDGSTIAIPDSSIVIKTLPSFTRWNRQEFPTASTLETEIGAKYYVFAGANLAKYVAIYPTDEFIGKIPFVFRFDRTANAPVDAAASVTLPPELFQPVY